MRLGAEFFGRAVLDVAPDLLGRRVVSRSAAGVVTVELTEVEAYAGVGEDPGSHAHRGRTPRTEVMFGPPGRAYVYFTYGMHHAINLVTAQPEQPYGCLIRAGDVIEGAELARARREAKPRKTPLPLPRQYRQPIRGKKRNLPITELGGPLPG